MPAELKNSDESDATAMTVWPKMMKGMANQGFEFTNAMQKIVTDSKLIVVPKKTCVCSPTSHGGSFRCLFHQTGATQKSSDCSGRNSCLKFNFKKMYMQLSPVDAHPQLSRFGRAAIAGASHDGELITMVLAKIVNKK